MKVWITDRWLGTDPETKKKSLRKANYGSGSRWQVSHYAEQTDGSRRLVSRNFERLVDAEAFRTKTENQLREGIYRPVDQEDLPGCRHRLARRPEEAVR